MSSGQVELDVPLRHLRCLESSWIKRSGSQKRAWEQFQSSPAEPKIQTRWQAEILQADSSLGQLVSKSLVLGTVFLGYRHSFIWGKSKCYSEQHSGKKRSVAWIFNFKQNLCQLLDISKDFAQYLVYAINVCWVPALKIFPELSQSSIESMKSHYFPVTHYKLLPITVSLELEGVNYVGNNDTVPICWTLKSSPQPGDLLLYHWNAATSRIGCDRWPAAVDGFLRMGARGMPASPVAIKSRNPNPCWGWVPMQGLVHPRLDPAGLMYCWEMT